MELRKPEQQNKESTEEVKGLMDALTEQFTEKIEVDFTEGTYIIEVDSFTLAIVLTGQVLEIRSIDVRGNSGVGHLVVETVQNFADENDLEVLVCNVVGTAQGFWEKMGYLEGEVEGEYFRPS